MRCFVKRKNINTFYIETNIKEKNKYNLFKFHRMIYPGYKMIDHINRIGTDNRKCNLRKTTPRENMLNCKLQKNNISKYNGISFNKNTERQRCDFTFLL